MLSAIGLFNRQLREFGEMLYQYDRDYLFSSEAFEREFNVTPTPLRDWIAEKLVTT